MGKVSIYLVRNFSNSFIKLSITNIISWVILGDTKKDLVHKRELDVDQVLISLYCKPRVDCIRIKNLKMIFIKLLTERV